MEILDFLDKARSFEALVYKQEMLCKQLNHSKAKLMQEHKREFIKNEETYDVYEVDEVKRGIKGRLIGAFAGMWMFLIVGLSMLENYSENQAGFTGLGIWVVCFVIGLIYDYDKHSSLIAHYKEENDSIRKINEDIQKKNLKIDEENKKLSFFHQAQKNQIQEEIDKAVSVLGNIRTLKSEFYNSAPYFIHSKYRELVVISTFYEYIATKRCTELEGYMGVINVYEQDLRFGAIMNKMDVIIQKLDEINMYQRALICIANETKEEVEKLSRSVETQTRKLSNQLRNIEENTYMTQYYSKITAECNVYQNIMNMWN